MNKKSVSVSALKKSIWVDPSLWQHVVLTACVLAAPQVHDGSVTVLAITRDDRGAYTCRAHSDQGEVLHTTRLLVQGNATHTRTQVGTRTHSHTHAHSQTSDPCPLGAARG